MFACSSFGVGSFLIIGKLILPFASSSLDSDPDDDEDEEVECTATETSQKQNFNNIKIYIDKLLII